MFLNARYVPLDQPVKKCFYNIETYVGNNWVRARWVNDRIRHEYDGEDIEDLNEAKRLLTKFRRKRYGIPARIVVVNLKVNAQVLDL